ncbi:dihydroxyacetone kinase subunit L [Chelatococcus asaccharovorans]|uniref:Dihydroxyacetone kinase-like protein n=1 Tax=Chelatococcus asaccharovorans TaxID=28210 RepID=A0A2V3TVR3_9HYPH|nr:dihydroxyacetone kinase subunit L [Chelatococcus asaccharovorans]MBS7705125.1 dihydroxyacetone kinase subunit L [Chelatococcus asaccharovorans]PXW53619.1 dihydroxyacetone kinase-like protein [Chelatococcus asaccharovorans]CAH1652684.1 Dihydroxyacetone kinase-like protein [Chelatococcus asaccharovorans]CAH1686263.1 Dihydroxyacetone kinase-like protein [Chelatococcus asaccharovorans]
MTGITVHTIRNAVEIANTRMATLEEELNRADSQLGDGDTGVMLSRVLGKFSETDISTSPDVGGALQMLARAAAATTGSSLGTLFMTALLAIGKKTKGMASVPWSDLSDLLQAALEAMIQRGGASLGDKTVLDAIHAVAMATQGVDDQAHIATKASHAADQALISFQGKPCKIGRARMFADKSIGIDDPGMLGFVRLVNALAAGR